ncbi:MAG: hypothetical protein QW666_04280, partial [Candidatus Woesearchaeota archaeon]
MKEIQEAREEGVKQYEEIRKQAEAEALKRVENERTKFIDLLARWVAGKYYSNPEFNPKDVWKSKYYKIAYNMKTNKSVFISGGDKYGELLKRLVNQYRGVKSKFSAAPAKAVDKKFVSAAKSFSNEQRKKVRDNIFTLGTEIEQLRKRESELRSKIIDAQKMNDVATGRKLAPELLKVTKGIATKTTRLNLYKQQEKY